MATMPEMMTPEQVARYLQVNKETVYRYIRERRLGAVRLGRYYRIPHESLVRFLHATTTYPSITGRDLPTIGDTGAQARYTQAMRDALERATALRAAIREDMGGQSFSSVADLLHEAREDELP